MNKLILCLILLTFVPSFAAAEKDPFKPYVSSTMMKGNKVPASSAKTRNYSSNLIQLDQHPISSFKVIGVIISPKVSYAVFRSVDSKDYFIKKGDVVGKEKGVIKKIALENVLVDVDKKVVTLPVSNKVVEMEGGKKG